MPAGEGRGREPHGSATKSICSTPMLLLNEDVLAELHSCLLQSGLPARNRPLKVWVEPRGYNWVSTGVVVLYHSSTGLARRLRDHVCDCLLCLGS